MMNMHKLGTVSRPERLFNNSTNSSAIKYLRLIRYTLCVYSAPAKTAPCCCVPASKDCYIVRMRADLILFHL